MALELSATPEAVLVEGAVGCGKTARLVARVGELLEGGAAPADILALAATPDAARVLRERLEAAWGERGRDVEATCVRDVALGLLATDAGRAATGRAGRLVTPVELGFIMEDMKTSGLKKRRLREMLKFFYRSWTELAEGATGETDWLLAGEEAEVHGLLKAVLASTGGILEPELSAMALRFLLGSPEALADAQRPHVLVDDYQMLSRASQHLANLLARDSIAMAADPTAVVEVFESYPYGEGIGEFTQANPTCDRVELTESRACAAASQAASRLREDVSPGAAPLAGASAEPASTSFAALAADSPEAEMGAVADAVAAALASGTRPEDVYVLAFHPAWERSAARALAARGIAVTAPAPSRVAVGDYRDLTRCAAARLLTALGLVADADDALAWRCWCGFGDYLANSAAFADVRAEAAAEGRSLIAMLEDAAAAAPAEGFPGTGIGRVVDAYRAGRALIARAQGLEGDELLAALAAELGLEGDAREQALAVVRALTAPESAPEDGASTDAATAAIPADAADLIERARRRMSAPTFEDTEGRVLVGDLAHLAGRSPEVLVLAGFVNGFFPARDYFDATVTTPDKQKLVRDADTRRLYVAAGKPTRRLAASWFTAIDLVSAERLKLEIERVALRRGERVARVAPSIYLASLEPTKAEPS
ncbi:UvrD-helicase domain-containing protein [Adlercreutzia caecimuris]|uniref:UvrD-helicase domain-containing protein n=1 Tax=Adlercreutzia caecimuris TaxID=671266 RepID=UPI00249552E0|nr:UvrD-helicase domain-containing protein [Adlercreutzia caecimuris]